MVELRPPRGFRDLPPELVELRRDVFSRIERIFRLYGFEQIETPSIESWEVLSGKYGDEAESRLIWRFQDPFSSKWYALRYDFTVPLARYVANNPNIQLPFKRYQIAPVWRHEEPQRGRYREFYQCDVDIVGSPYPEADAEIVNLTIDVMREFGFKEFTVRINDRRLLAGIFEFSLGIANPFPVYRVIDKLDKKGLEGVKSELKAIGLSEHTVLKIEEILSTSGSPLEIIESLRNSFRSNDQLASSLDHLESMFSLIKDVKFTKLDLSLARGLDYYTGPVFETVVSEPRIGSLTGGGRYDKLLGTFLNRDIPATGTSIGVERLIDAGLELGLFKALRKPPADVCIIALVEEARKEAWKLANELRASGIKTVVDLMRGSEDRQRKHALRLDVKLLVYLGHEEINMSKVTVYKRANKQRITVSREDAIRTVKTLLTS